MYAIYPVNMIYKLNNPQKRQKDWILRSPELVGEARHPLNDLNYTRVSGQPITYKRSTVRKG